MAYEIKLAANAATLVAIERQLNGSSDPPRIEGALQVAKKNEQTVIQIS